MRKKQLLLNTLSALMNQVTMVVCAFILPRLILITYGSEVNGLVASVQQFLTVITFMELGVGAVVQSSLYLPLANNDKSQISKIMLSAGKFFRRLAEGMILYVAFLILVYPLVINHNFDWLYTDTLILAMCISYFAQYFFGLKNQLLVIADQRGYIHYGLNTFVLILNNILGVVLISSGFSIQFVKLSTSLCLLIRPLVLEVYVKKHYSIDRKIKYDEEPIKQKWNGVAQHIASVVLNSTDTIVLTIFSTLSNVSIYNVYYLVVNGLRNLVIALSSGMQSLIGNLLAKKEYKKLEDVFSAYESAFHFITTFIFGTASILIVPFVQVYTASVSDVNYNVPIFAYLMCFANLAYCFRTPYNSVVLAAGHYKQTQNSAWIEMILNIVISVLSVVKFGLVGVAIGTLFAMLYRTLYMVWYLSKNIIYRKPSIFIIHFIVDIVSIAAIIWIGSFFELNSVSYFSWIILAIRKGIVSLFVCLAFNYLVFGKNLKQVISFYTKKSGNRLTK